MRTVPHLRSRALAASALGVVALAAAGPALAGNTIRLDITGTGAVKSLSIAQDAVDNSNTITTTGLAGGAQIPIRGKWDSISITQTGAGNILKSTGLSGTAGSTTAALALSYDAGASTGGNVHSLTIGGTTAPANASITATVVNTDSGAGVNTITDVLDGSSLTYALDVDGTGNTISDTLAATGAVTLNQTVHGGTAASGNTITNTITGATSANVTVAVFSNGNTITNTSDGLGDKTISITLPSGGADGNTVSNDFTGGTGAQSSTLLVNGTTSKVNFGLTAGGATTSSAVTLTDVVGAAGAAGKLALSQTGANAALTLAVTGTGFTMGSSLAGGAGVVVSQGSSNAVLNANITAAANGYTYSISQ